MVSFPPWYITAALLTFVAIGAGLIWQGIFLETIRRRRTRYTLTDSRAFIGYTPVLSKPRLKHWPIDANTILDYKIGDLATIWFHQETHVTQNGHYTVKFGFERIGEGNKVYRLMRDAQKDDG